MIEATSSCTQGQRGVHHGTAFCCDRRCAMCSAGRCARLSKAAFGGKVVAAAAACCLTRETVLKSRAAHGLPPHCRDQNDIGCILEKVPSVVPAIEYSDAWLQKYNDTPVMDCDSEFMRHAYLYSDRPRMLCGRPTYAACGSMHLGLTKFQRQLRRECLFLDFASRLPSTYKGWVVLTSGHTVWDEQLLEAYIKSLPRLHAHPLVFAGMGFNPFHVISAEAMRFVFGNESRRWNECKQVYALRKSRQMKEYEVHLDFETNEIMHLCFAQIHRASVISRVVKAKKCFKHSRPVGASFSFIMNSARDGLRRPFPLAYYNLKPGVPVPRSPYVLGRNTTTASPKMHCETEFVQ